MEVKYGRVLFFSKQKRFEEVYAPFLLLRFLLKILEELLPSPSLSFAPHQIFVDLLEAITGGAQPHHSLLHHTETVHSSVRPLYLMHRILDATNMRSDRTTL
jgi:hypothetical protein